MSVGARNARIDLLRGVSIILVLLHHFNIAYSLRDTEVSRVFGWDAVHAVTRNGNYAVTMFFVISGYLITSNAVHRWGTLGKVRLGPFYVLRAARILPCLVLLVAIVNVLAAAGIPIFENHPEIGGKVAFWIVDAAALGFWMNVLMGHAGWLNYVLCVLWSLSVEEVFYAAFPVLCRVLRREHFLLAAWAFFIVAGPVWRAAHQDDDAGFLYAYLACFDGIAIGCCTAVLGRRVSLSGRFAAAAQIAVAGCMGLLYLGWSIGTTNVLGVTAMSLGTAFLILGGRNGTNGSRALDMLKWCGRLSYELYLFHLLVLAAMKSAAAPEGNGKLMLLAAYLGVSCAAAWIVARGFAAPINRRVRAAMAMFDVGQRA